MQSLGQIFRTFASSVHPDSCLRMAPTPSGFLHIGNAFNFLLNWAAARSAGAKILLRMDDLDTERKREAYVEDVLESIRWLGIDFDGLPVFQSEQTARHHAFLERLRETGLLFACRKSRRELAEHDGLYPPEFREQGLSLDARDVNWRIRTPEGFPLPDFVVRRRDGIPAYQVASLADDLHFGTTHLIRGEDLEDSTRAQMFLAEVLGETAFLQVKCLHHPLFLEKNGEKLSKSAGASSLKAMRESGIAPESVYRQMGEMLGWEISNASDCMAMLKDFKEG
jgi:Glutamyl- and glutaminyl-tRNA synthetases